MASHSDPTVAATPSVPHGPGVPPPAPQLPAAAPTNLGGSSDARNALPVPARNKKEPRTFASPSSATVNSAPPLLLGVSNLPFYTNQHLETNTFTPSAIVMFALLAELDANMSNTFRFLQSAPNWIPFVSQAYISILFYIHVFRVARESNTISNEQFQLLQWFESVYDFRTMMIPGPLVPIFQSMAFTSGPFEWIGNISPSITDDYRPVKSSGYVPNNGINYVLPNVPLIIDQIQWFLSSFNITPANEHYITDNFYSDLFGVPAATGSFGESAMTAPNARFLTGTSANQYRAFKSQARAFRFPARLTTTPSNTYLNWFEALRFRSPGVQTTNYQWFSTMSATMQRYCQFVRGSVPLSAISLTGLGACTPLYAYQPASELNTATSLVPEESHKDSNNNNIVQSAAHFSAFTPSSLSAIGEHFDPELEELAEQFSAASQVNVTFTALPATSGLPTNAYLRTGLVWSLPKIRTSPVIDVLPTHGPLIMTHYHSDARNTS
nr:MAG: capsid protein [Leptosphaeria biglobosa partitivirus 1]